MTSSNGNIFRVTGPLCGEFTGPGEFPTQRPVTGALMFSLIRVCINGRVNNREADKLRRHRGHYDVNVMFMNQPRTIANDHDIILQNACRDHAIYHNMWIVNPLFYMFPQANTSGVNLKGCLVLSWSIQLVNWTRRSDESPTASCSMENIHGFISRFWCQGC